jgi:hypothetical protein
MVFSWEANIPAPILWPWSMRPRRSGENGRQSCAVAGLHISGKRVSQALPRFSIPARSCSVLEVRRDVGLWQRPGGSVTQTGCFQTVRNGLSQGLLDHRKHGRDRTCVQYGVNFAALFDDDESQPQRDRTVGAVDHGRSRAIRVDAIGPTGRHRKQPLRMYRMPPP